MGTRHLICIWWKGQWVVAQYGQWDGYPEGQGVDIFQFLTLPRNLENLKLGLERHTYQASKEDLEAIHAECQVWDDNFDKQQRASNLAPIWNTHDMTGIKQLYPSLTRDAAARVLGLIARAAVSGEDDEEDAIKGEQPKKTLPLYFDLEFANDSTFCEWAYVIDLDKEVLEIFGGSEYKHDNHRFKDVGKEDDTVPAHVCTFGIAELLDMRTEDEFLRRIKVATGQENEDADA